MTNTVITEMGDELFIALAKRGDPDQRLIAQEPVRLCDLLLHFDEVWLKAVSAGALGTDLGKITRHVSAGETRQGGKIDGFFIELRDGRQSFRSHYPIESLLEIAQRAAQSLVSHGILQQDETFHYFLKTIPGGVKTGEDSIGKGAQATKRHEPLILEQACLSDYLQSSSLLCDPSSAVEEASPFAHELFFSKDAWEEGKEAARRGGENESAGVFIGRVLQDAESSQIFSVIECCIDAEHATEEKYAVTLSGESWANVHDQLTIRRRQLNRPHERILGSVHGHNWFPSADEEGNRRCENCHLADYCNRTTAVASTADIDWHKTIFRGSPWATLLIWGFNAREEDDWKLYGLSNASLARRALRILD